MTLITRRNKIHSRIRKTVFGTSSRPRLSVYRSLTTIYAQLINDTSGKTLAAVSSLKAKGSLTKKADLVGKEIAEKAKELKITSAVFDRGGFAYKGSVKIVADSARQNGLNI